MTSIIWEILSFLLAVLALSGTAYTYFKHDSKLKQQEKLLNQIQIAEAKEREENKKKARIRGKIEYSGKGENTLIINNDGEADARSIMIEILDNSANGCIWYEDKLFIHQLSCGNSYKFIFMTIDGASQDIHFKYSWEDDFAANNQYDEFLQRR